MRRQELTEKEKEAGYLLRDSQSSMWAAKCELMKQKELSNKEKRMPTPPLLPRVLAIPVATVAP